MANTRIVFWYTCYIQGVQQHPHVYISNSADNISYQSCSTSNSNYAAARMSNDDDTQYKPKVGPLNKQHPCTLIKDHLANNYGPFTSKLTLTQDGKRGSDQYSLQILKEQSEQKLKRDNQCQYHDNYNYDYGIASIKKLDHVKEYHQDHQMKSHGMVSLPRKVGCIPNILPFY